MNDSLIGWKVLVLSTASVLLLVLLTSGAAPPDKTTGNSKLGTAQTQKVVKSRVTLNEAKGQAQLLHETVHATLQFVHQQYFRQGEKLQIPSRTLDSVFEELSRERDIEFHWISVNADAMNIDHEPQDAFEKKAAEVLSTDKDFYERVENGVYRRAGKIHLLNQCLKCHLPNRKKTNTRSAGLVINMRLKK